MLGCLEGKSDGCVEGWRVGCEVGLVGVVWMEQRLAGHLGYMKDVGEEVY